MRKATTLLAIVFSLPVAHTQTRIEAMGFHVGSYHLPAYDHNNRNPGNYVRWSNGATLGTYFNSERHQSAYVGYTQQWGAFSLTTGLITGYERKLLLPMVVPSVRVAQFDNVSVRIAVLPRFERYGSTVVHLMIEVKQ